MHCYPLRTNEETEVGLVHDPGAALISVEAHRTTQLGRTLRPLLGMRFCSVEGSCVSGTSPTLADFSRPATIDATCRGVTKVWLLHVDNN